MSILCGTAGWYAGMHTRISAVGAGLVAILGISLTVALLAISRVGEVTFLAMFWVICLSALAILFYPRLVEVNLKEMKLVLDRIERLKSELDEKYGSLDGIQIDRINHDEDWYRRLGANAGASLRVGAVMNYVTGCMTRERQRLAMIFMNGLDAERIARAIVDSALDDRVFKWASGGSPLDEAPKSIETRD